MTGIPECVNGNSGMTPGISADSTAQVPFFSGTCAVGLLEPTLLMPGLIFLAAV